MKLCSRPVLLRRQHQGNPLPLTSYRSDRKEKKPSITAVGVFGSKELILHMITSFELWPHLIGDPTFVAVFIYK